MNCEDRSRLYLKVNRYIALAIFLVTASMYYITAQSSVAYWDCAEYAATSPTLQVPHPPGAPLFTLITRMASMIPIVGDVAMRMNLVSGLASALAVMFLYLIGARVISGWEGFPSDLRGALSVFGPAAAGALALSVSDTFWFNAVESGLFAASVFFISIIVWLAMVWSDSPERNGNDKYLLLAAYLLGLSSGVHQLCLLSFFPVAVLIYLKNNEFQWKSALRFAALAIPGFFVIYPGIVKWMVAMLSGTWGFGPLEFSNSFLIKMVPPGAVAIAIYVLWRAAKKKQRIVILMVTAGLLVLAGYSTYTIIYLRAKSNPPINENNPSTLHNLVSYLEREQYGKQPVLWPRRWSPEPKYQVNYAKYSSDLDYFWSYQVDHMYLRYLGFNFIGRAGDIQDAPVALISSPHGWHDGEKGYPARYYAIPFLIGLFGLWYHYKRNWKSAAVFTVMFVVMGFALAVYFNMADPQPRERDYFFVGSFFVFALWIGVGTSGLIDLAMSRLRGAKWRTAIAAVVGLVVLLAVPVNMFRENLFTHDRHDNFAPLDISYDLLQSCPKNAVLFTGGDNDTFPLWYLQETLRVRTDVRVVCLSLSNTDWYLLQLKNEMPNGAEKVPFSFSDSQITSIADAGAFLWKARTFTLPVPQNVYRRFGISVSSSADSGTIRYTIDPTIGSGDARGIRVQDVMVNDIVTANKWKRPICFAITVSPRDCIGLQKYFVRQGLVNVLTPLTREMPYYSRINVPVMRECLFNTVDSCVSGPHYGFMYRDLNKPGVYYDSDTRNMAYTIRDTFVTLAAYYQARNDSSECVSVLDHMEDEMPFSSFPADYRMVGYVARLYHLSGAADRFRKCAALAERGALKAISYDPDNLEGNSNPYSVLLGLYEMGKEYRKSLGILELLRQKFPADPQIKLAIENLRSELSRAPSGAAKREDAAD